MAVNSPGRQARRSRWVSPEEEAQLSKELGLLHLVQVTHSTERARLVARQAWRLRAATAVLGLAIITFCASVGAAGMVIFHVMSPRAFMPWVGLCLLTWALTRGLLAGTDELQAQAKRKLAIWDSTHPTPSRPVRPRP